MTDWDGFGFDDVEEYKIDLSGIPTEELEAELARRGGHVWKGLADLQKRIEVGRCNKDGIVCPACMRKARNQKRPFNANMGRGVAFLWRAGRGEERQWVHMPSALPRSVVKQGGDWSVAKHWGLCEEQVNEDTRKRNSGWWRATEKLGPFLRGQTTIPKFVVLYDSQCLGFEGPDLRYTDTLPEFDFAAFMAEAGVPGR